MFAEVWATVRRIPEGKVATYGAVAEAAGFPGAGRQVVWALRACKSPLPWHRVVGAGGKILLAGEIGLEQRLRLSSEGLAFERNRIDLTKYGFAFRRRQKAPVRKRPSSGTSPFPTP